MKFKVWFALEERYLSENELKGGYINFEYTKSNEYRRIEEFKVNLLTGKIQTEQYDRCFDPERSTSYDVFQDDENFRIEIDDTEDRSEEV